MLSECLLHVCALCLLRPARFCDLFLRTIINFATIMLKSKPVQVDETEKKKCVCLLGNGPSLRNHLDERGDFFLDKEMLCVNDFALTEEFKKYKPRYYALADPDYFNEEQEVTSPAQFSNREKIISVFKKDVNWEMEIFIPSYRGTTKCIQDIMEINPKIKFRLINSGSFYGFQFVEKWLRKNKKISYPFQNVLILGLVACIYMNYRKIYLFGADHDWMRNLFVGKDNRVYISDTHFYEENPKKLTPMKKSSKSYFTMAELCMAFATDFSVYEKINQYSLENGSHIYNMNPNSFIDSFDKVIS